MTRGLQQQDQDRSVGAPVQSAPAPQHGQKAAEKPLPVREPRSYKPRPGH
jgi:hypothetical protein